MVLPPPSSLTLQECVEFLVGQGESEKDAKLALKRAFIDGDLKARGFYNHEKHIIPENVWSDTDIHWNHNQIPIPNNLRDHKNSISYFHNYYESIKVSRNDLYQWCPPVDTMEAQQPRFSENPRMHTHIVYQSPFMELMYAAQTHFGVGLTYAGPPTKKEEIEEWLRDHWGEYLKRPSSTHLIEVMGTLIRDPELMTGGNRPAPKV
ncbi:MAG: hypothetical protein HOM25_06290 [Rhodospirillaceae bacterium]|jgi:hypothetical protein|nr:hypothetical protein [Rhodospirillaceae bacterium]MBT5663958.1 hypothetical protein [Rhodospirillaceae bacterium]MBT5811249.1 hypothetical protein [Rhodospirillaceae bacterium]